jgi:glycosyltransferase involved in cell wall biosynthesis
VVVPTYNRLELLREAVASVLNQAAVDFELILVDDGSTDGTPRFLSFLEDWTTGSRRAIRVVRLEHTGMPGAVRNAGVRTASADLLAFLDSDDLWCASKLAVQVALHRDRPEIQISHTREHWLRNGRTISQKSQKHRRRGFVFADALVKCTIGPSTAMISRALFQSVGGFREDMDFAEDYEFWLRVVWNHPVEYVDEPLTVKRAGHHDQLSLRFGEIERIRLQALRDLVDRGTFEDPESARLARVEVQRKCRIYATGARKHGRGAEATKYEKLAEEYEPSLDPDGLSGSQSGDSGEPSV